MPISRVNNTAANSTPASGAGARTTFRPPWAKDLTPAAAASTDKNAAEKSSTETKPATPAWRRPAPAAKTAVNKTADGGFEMPVLKKTVKTQDSIKKPENGEKEVSVKLQSREIKVPIMTERAKLKPPPMKPKEPEPKEIEPEPAEPEEPKPIATNKFVRPVLRKTSKVDEQIKEIEKPKLPTVVLKKTEPIKKEIEVKKRIDINLQKTPVTKKDMEIKPTLGKKLAPVKFSGEFFVSSSIFFQFNVFF